MAIDEAKLEAFMHKVVTELGAGLGFPLHRLGDQLGIWKAMAGAGPLTVSEVAERSGCDERYIKEWLAAESAGGYVDYDAATEAFSLPAEAAFAMAEAFPNSTFTGFDYHDASIVAARKTAAEVGVADRVNFEVAPAQSYPGTGYDLVTSFDCLHDMGDPDGAARHVRSTLADDGTWLLVEPYSPGDLVADSNPVGRLFYECSATICLPASLADEGRRGLGNQVGDNEWAEILGLVGFSRCRRATETPFN